MIEQIKKELKKAIVGQEEMIDSLLIALLAQGHVLLEGMPGLAKTTTVKILAMTLGVEFKRIQFTPDLLPSDILGASIFNPKTNDFKIKKGPIFTNLLLADEINRAPAKVQSALLEAMQERQVTISDQTHPLPSPFVVMATQNPIEQEGTYPLPEAQLDRFMLKVDLGYNSFEQELEILNKNETNQEPDIQQVAAVEDLLQASQQSQQIFVHDALKKYIVSLIVATREHPDLLYGASPRGAIDLLRASKAKAYIQGQDHVTPDHILHLIKPALRHRVVPSYEARADGRGSDKILEEIIENLPIP
ncbi:MAG: ATPase [Epsilonproteobacteria bacterium]|nr:ATPase [Campylobacterota bacterium]NPA64942.1 MoxR family ATPase [Campylobacterota bacterium]